MQLTVDARAEVYVQFVASYATDQIIIYMTPRPSGVKVDLSRPDHAILPCGASVPLDQQLTYLYFMIYRRISATSVEYTKNVLTFSMQGETHLQVCPTYIKSTRKRTTCGNTD